jgi:hypothetical protein
VKEPITDIIDQLGFNRLVHISNNKHLNDEEFIVVEQAKDFEIVRTYIITKKEIDYETFE